MKDLFDKIVEKFEEFKLEAQINMSKGNKTAGIRARKATVDLAKMMKDYREKSVERDKQ